MAIIKGPIVISGGGIGGLSAAVGLANAGIASVVLEKAGAFGEIGAGIQLAPNAFHCFDALGITKEAHKAAIFIDHLRLMDALSGTEITSIPLDEPFRARFNNPYAVVHRADLHKALLLKCQNDPRVDLRVKQKVTGYRQDGSNVAVQIAGQSDVQGRALVGADGLHSVIRGQLVGDGAPQISGHATYRSVIPVENMPEDLRWNAATLWAGPKCHIVHYPLKGWKLFNLVVTYHRHMTEPVAGRSVPKSEVRAGFEHIAPVARQIIEHGQDWKLWVLCDREPVQNWVEGRVALLGDAAHPMLQYFAQGAAMAMEDGVCLAKMLATHDDTNKALMAYQDARAVRTARVQMNSRLIGDYIYHPDDAKAAVRDHIMQGMSPQDWYDRLAWLYDGPRD